MDFHLLKDIIDLMWEFENSNSKSNLFSNDLSGFKQWVIFNSSKSETTVEPDWEGKENGRSPESVISTFIVHMNRYAKNYSKSAIYGSDFSTQEDFIYLINLKAFGEMTKMELIKRNIQDKPVGMQIINRLISQDWVQQNDSETDKRSKVINITSKGLEALDKQMGKIRQATNIVSGDLSHIEKMELIRLLKKLNDFHHPIYCQNLEPEELLNEALKTRLTIVK
ncbi:MarR family winged helix-turn-helix transcriptional regulator [Solitalea sp. MAHUQ-68]|uniref:MarR family winged helix-turn-helix transcriptional regulator n=1 Tax=Solitalea agri TaxID=2953739 RepID=A0A9X2JCK0_9SPHI|nr:MarR family transcriptional regulator [Solitalea agri]MCO4292614.1 MarR family winged helix-turn-helix transcriptional regulator [Solitalea agri]